MRSNRSSLSDASLLANQHYASRTNASSSCSVPAFVLDRLLIAQSFMPTMSGKPDSSLTPLNWRRLHLSRAKLKASSRTSALLSGFAMVAMVEVQLSSNEKQVPLGLLIGFTICTTLLVSLHMLALMISTCILPNVEAVASMNGLIAPNESPHGRLCFYVEIAWTISTVFGILLFLVEIALLCWVKFWELGQNGIIAATSATIILIPIGCIFIAFAVHFYRKLVNHKYENSTKGLHELECMHTQLDFGESHGRNPNDFSRARVLNI